MRLIVRRVKPTPGSQLALFVNYSYHAFISDRAGELLELEADHRRTPRSRTRSRPQVRRPEPSPLGPLRRERGVARGAGDRAQPRPLDRVGLGEGIVTTRTLRRRYFALAGRLTGPALEHSRSAWAQPPWRGYGRYRSRPDARSQRRPGSEARASMPAHASRTLAPAPSAPPSRTERRLLAPVRPRHRPASAATPAELPARQPAPASIGGFGRARARHPRSLRTTGRQDGSRSLPWRSRPRGKAVLTGQRVRDQRRSRVPVERGCHQDL